MEVRVSLCKFRTEKEKEKGRMQRTLQGERDGYKRDMEPTSREIWTIDCRPPARRPSARPRADGLPSSETDQTLVAIIFLPSADRQFLCSDPVAGKVQRSPHAGITVVFPSFRITLLPTSFELWAFR